MNGVVTSIKTWVQRQNYIKNFVKILRGFHGLGLKTLALLVLLYLLGYNDSGTFFTVELKVTKGKKLKFSPHQIAFHVKHPHNTFIIAEALGPRASKTFPISMYRGSRIRELVRDGLKLEACSLGLEACCLELLSI